MHRRCKLAHAKTTDTILGKRKIHAVAVIPRPQVKPIVDPGDDPVGDGVNRWVVGWLVVALGPYLAGIVQVGVRPGVGMVRIGAHEGMATAKVVDVHREAVGRTIHENRYVGQQCRWVGPSLDRLRALRWTGPGGTVPRIRPVKGAIVRLHTLKKVPTGRLDEEDADRENDPDQADAS